MNNEITYINYRNIGLHYIEVNIGEQTITKLHPYELFNKLIEHKDWLETLTSEILIDEMKEYDESKENTNTKLQWLQQKEKPQKAKQSLEKNM